MTTTAELINILVYIIVVSVVLLIPLVMYSVITLIIAVRKMNK